MQRRAGKNGNDKKKLKIDKGKICICRAYKKYSLFFSSAITLSEKYIFHKRIFIDSINYFPDDYLTICFCFNKIKILK